MVIQRWQSVLLLVAAGVMAAFTFMSLGQVQTPEITYNITTMGFAPEGVSTDGAQACVSTWYFFILSLLTVLVPLIAIFTFKRTSLQKTLCLVNVLFLIAVYAVGALTGYNTFDGGTVGWSSLIIAPLLAICATIMAYNRIRSDERLLRSADRLR